MAVTSAPSQRRRRVSYVLPAQTGPVPELALPAAGASSGPGRLGDPRPLLLRRSDQQPLEPPSLTLPSRPLTTGPASRVQPLHCLAVSSLALDLSTIVVQADTDGESRRPRGILYSGGRDGLVCAHDLALPMRPRSRMARGGRAEQRRRHSARRTRYGMSDDEDDSSMGEDEDEEKDSEDEAADMAVDAQIAQRASSSSPSLSGPLPPPPQRTKPNLRLPYEQRWEVDSAALGTDLPQSTFRQAAQPHTDWINALILCNLNRTVITASSDCTIRAWSPHDPHACLRPSLIGEHTDFVRALAHAQQAHWVASAGFDRRVRLWDVNEGRCEPLLDLPDGVAKGSIYTIACDPAGRMIAVGSPDRAVRVWDPRQGGQRIAKLVGHGDNVRCLLTSEDGRAILSGAADASIRLWDTRMQRCLSTFAHHSESVWSLFSTDPDLDVFYSADRAGYVCKVDMTGCADIADGECAVLLRDQSGTGPQGVNAIVAADDSFVWTASGSSSVRRWRDIPARSSRATPAPVRAMSPLAGSAVHFDSEPVESPTVPLLGTDGLPARRGVVFAAQHELALRRTTSAGSTGLPTAINRPSSLRIPSSRPPFHSPQQSATFQSSDTIDGLSVNSLVPLGLPDDVYHRPIIYETLPSAMTPMRSVVNVSPLGIMSSESVPDEPGLPTISQARARYEDRVGANDATPIRSTPDEIIRGRRGLVQVQILNDRRHAVAADAAGSLTVWDLLMGRCVGQFVRDDLPPRIKAKDAIELVISRIAGEGAIPAWSTADARVGRLTVHLDGARVFDAEAYADESGFAESLGGDARFNLGKTVLRNLFDAFVAEEVRLVQTQQPPPSVARLTGDTTAPPMRLQRSTAPSHISLAGIANTAAARDPGMSIALATPALTPALPPPTASLTGAAITLAKLTPIPQSPRGRTPAALSESESRSGSRTRTLGAVTPTATSVGTNGSVDYFGQKASPDPSSPSPIPPTSPASAGGLMGRLRGFGRGSKRPTPAEQTPSIAAAPMTIEESADDSAVLSAATQAHIARLNEIYSRPIVPPPGSEVPIYAFPPDTEIVIAEEAGATLNPLYRGLVSTGALDTAEIELAAPGWTIDCLLANRLPVRDPVKIAFLLAPWNGAATAGIDDLPPGNHRLTANRVLRLAKVQTFIAEHAGHGPGLQSSVSRISSHVSLASAVSDGDASTSSQRLEPSDIEILAGGVVGSDGALTSVGSVLVPPSMTLAGVVRFVYKRGGDLPLWFRRKAMPIG